MNTPIKTIRGLEQMDKLWDKRKDFEVWVLDDESREREYITNEKFDRIKLF